jgi:GntR family transcriptional regulator
MKLKMDGSVSRNSHFPLYYQIRQQIEQSILSGAIKPGDKLSSENELAEQFQVSRMTIRRAIDYLVSQGILKRIQGQGTFVTEKPLRTAAIGITRWSFERIHESSGVHHVIVSITQSQPSLRVANALHTMPGEMVVSITTLLSENDTTYGYYIHHIPKLMVPNVEAWNLENKSVLEFLAHFYDFKFGRVVERVRAITAEEDAVEMLNVKPNSPLLSVSSLIYLASGIPVIQIDAIYRADYTYRGHMKSLMEHNQS